MMTQRIQFDDRAAHLADLKRQIAAGSYDTDWRFSLAVDMMLNTMLDDFERDGHEEGDGPGRRPRQPR
jgi:hypothetical protein